jgi:hypothetical protein
MFTLELPPPVAVSLRLRRPEDVDWPLAGARPVRRDRCLPPD